MNPDDLPPQFQDREEAPPLYEELPAVLPDPAEMPPPDEPPPRSPEPFLRRS